MNNLALCLARAGQNLDEALKLIDDALAISGPMADVLDSRAIVHIARQEPEKALEDLAAAIKDDGSAEQYFHQAWAYSLGGQEDRGLGRIRRKPMKKGLDPKDLDPREILGLRSPEGRAVVAPILHSVWQSSTGAGQGRGGG